MYCAALRGKVPGMNFTWYEIEESIRHFHDQEARVRTDRIDRHEAPRPARRIFRRSR